MRNFNDVVSGISMSLSSTIANSKALLGTFIVLLSFSFTEPVPSSISSLSSEREPMLESDHLSINQSGPLADNLLSNDYSKFFVHEAAQGGHEIIKNIQNGIEVILRSDKVEILKKANPSKGFEEVSTFLQFKNVNSVMPKRQDLVESKTLNVRDVYDQETVEFIHSDFMDVNIYKSIVYTNIYNEVDLEVVLNDTGDLIFNLNNTIENPTFPFDIKVCDAKEKSSTNEIITNEVKITSNSDNMFFQNRQVGFEKRNSSRNSYSFSINLSNPTLK